jgi:hypothetical protein
MWREIIARFGVIPTAIYTWGDTIYNPAGGEIAPDLVAHEAVHCDQQAALGSPEVWWRHYLVDPAFVLSQEAPAYGRQFAWIRAHHHNRGRQARELHQLARILSSPMYGNCCTFQSALKLIKGFS